MGEERTSTAALLEQWREATRAAEIADRLAKLVEEAVRLADRNTSASEEIAVMAERAARAAERAATISRDAANKAKSFSAESRNVKLHDATSAVDDARVEEGAARDRYHDAERQARERVDGR